jgi:Protein of unknown function (DUF3040)
VPLSKHEQRQLDQIEQALRAGDPRFADAVHAADPRVHYRRRVIAAAPGLVIGVGLLLAGVAIKVIRSRWRALWACSPAACGRRPATSA